MSDSMVLFFLNLMQLLDIIQFHWTLKLNKNVVQNNSDIQHKLTFLHRPCIGYFPFTIKILNWFNFKKGDIWSNTIFKRFKIYLRYINHKAKVFSYQTRRLSHIVRTCSSRWSFRFLIKPYATFLQSFHQIKLCWWCNELWISDHHLVHQCQWGLQDFQILSKQQVCPFLPLKMSYCQLYDSICVLYSKCLQTEQTFYFDT